MLDQLTFDRLSADVSSHHVFTNRVRLFIKDVDALLEPTIVEDNPSTIVEDNPSTEQVATMAEAMDARSAEWWRGLCERMLAALVSQDQEYGGRLIEEAAHALLQEARPPGVESENATDLAYALKGISEQQVTIVALREMLALAASLLNDVPGHPEFASVLADTTQAAVAARAAIEAPWREALSKHPPFKLADYERCGYCAQHWPCDAAALLEPTIVEETSSTIVEETLPRGEK